jgi:hypothetical protein
VIYPEYAEEPDPKLNVQFVDSLAPKLLAGRYTLSAYQTLTKDGNAVDEGYLPPATKPVTQQVQVRAPRFGVEPEWIHGAYPPSGATGTYSDVLPHVTLTRPTLPWERAGDLPWMAVLVFGEGELENDPLCLGLTDARTVQQLTTRQEIGVVLPTFDRGDPIPAEDEAKVCRTILVPRATFHGVAPTKEELPYLTHLRRVNEEHQSVTYSLDLIRVGDYAVLISNRVPRAAGGRYVGHLVSLEGWLPYLPAKDKEKYEGPQQKLRLISLWSWAFETLPDRAPGFAALTDNFVRQEGKGGVELLLRVPVGERRSRLAGPEQHEVVDRLDAGYLPLSCRTESGRSTFGWYRGPFTPVPAELRTSSKRRRCAAEALIYLEQYGIFDISLAVAFTAGRGVALADRQFCLALLRLRAKLRRHVLPGLEGEAGPVTVAAPAPNPVGGARKRLEQLVLNGLGDRLARALAEPLPDLVPIAGPTAGFTAGADAGSGAGFDTAPAPETKSSGLAVAPVVTPLPEATTLPAVADLSVERLRAEPALRARLRSALAVVTGTAPPASTPPASAPATVADVFTVSVSQPIPMPDEDLKTVRDWLVNLRNLAGVPFAHLVPDTRMLPAESLRFFYVDPDWTTTLVEGALSVGLAHRFDLVVDEEIFGPEGVARLPQPRGQLTGLLIRSQLVTGWPALEVRPYLNREETHGEEALRVVRREALASDVLLVIVEGEPGRIEIAEPQQGVHFGIDEPEGSESDDPLEDGIIRLRAVTNSPEYEIGEETGGEFPQTPGLRHYLRDPGPGQPDTVFRLWKLADGLKDALGLEKLTPSQFAIQMINAAQRRTFRTDETAR